MARHRSMLTAGLAACLLAGCATPSGSPPPAHAVAAVGKVVASLGDEAMQRLGTERFRGMPVVVSTAVTSGSGVEPIVAEFLRTRWQEQGATVNVACAGRCAAREGNNYVARSHVVAIVSTGSGEVALERK